MDFESIVVEFLKSISICEGIYPIYSRLSLILVFSILFSFFSLIISFIFLIFLFSLLLPFFFYSSFFFILSLSRSSLFLPLSLALSFPLSLFFFLSLSICDLRINTQTDIPFGLFFSGLLALEMPLCLRGGGGGVVFLIRKRIDLNQSNLHIFRVRSKFITIVIEIKD